VLKYALWRVVVAVPLLIAATVISFGVLQLLPGNPVSVLTFGTQASPAEVAAIKASLGLDKPVIIQYLLYLGHLLQGNLGTSYINQESVAQEIVTRIPYTMELAGAALLVALVVGIPLGAVAAWRRNSVVDRLVTGISVLGVAVPYFWLGLIMVLIFAVKLHWFPSLGTGGLSSLVLPAVSLGVGYAALITRLFRASLIGELDKPYVRFAEARGVPSRRVFLRAATKGAAGPVLTGIGIQFGNMLSGAAATEIIFGRPGIGSLFVQAILNKDIPTVQGLIVLVTAIYITANLVVDLVKAGLDPRVRVYLAGQTI
jgi:ABC-type dipeptide/oligopeptide/nickel transport system permease component